MQMVFVLSAMILGMLYNYNFSGLAFNCNLCLFAGLTIVMPSLFNLHLNDIKLLKAKRVLIVKNIFANYFILPIVAVGIGILSNDAGIAGGLFLLSILAGGGMVMNWIKESGFDVKVGVMLFGINIFFLVVSFFMFKYFSINFYNIFDITANVTSATIDLPLSRIIENLIIIPFIASIIIIKFLPIVSTVIKKNHKIIANVSISIIVFYLFALEKNRVILDIEISLFIKAFVAVVLFYIAAFFVAKILYNTQNKDEGAAFWHIINRYITLALAISTYSTGAFGATFILPILMAYFIQLPLSIGYCKYLRLNEKKMEEEVESILV